MDHLLSFPASVRTTSRGSATVADADHGVGGVRVRGPGDRSRNGFGAAMREAMGRDDRGADRGPEHATDRAEPGPDRGGGRAMARGARGLDRSHEPAGQGDRVVAEDAAGRPGAGSQDGRAAGTGGADAEAVPWLAVENTLTALDGEADDTGAGLARAKLSLSALDGGADPSTPPAGWLLTPLADHLAGATAVHAAADTAGESAATGEEFARLVDETEAPGPLEQLLVDAGAAEGGEGSSLTDAADLFAGFAGTLPSDAEVDADTEDGAASVSTADEAGFAADRQRAVTEREVVASSAGATVRVAATPALDVDAEVATPRLRVGDPYRTDRRAERGEAAPRVPAPNARAQSVNAEFRAAGLAGDGPLGVDLPRAESVRLPTLPAGVQRVLDLVAQLEKMPPPRHLVLELGDLRVRVGLEDGQVRLTVLSGNQREADELLADARDALAQQGFDLPPDRDDAAEQDTPNGSERPSAAQDRPPARARRTPTGLRL